MPNIPLPLFTLLLSLLLCPVAAIAQPNQFTLKTKPVWELGLAAGFFRSTNYPGSNEPRQVQAVFPFFIYRSEIFRFGDGGVGAVAIEEPRFKVDFSFGGSLNAQSDDNTVREGLPDLDVLFEVGPQLQYKLFQNVSANGSESELVWNAKIRAVISTNFTGVQAQGFVYGTGLNYTKRDVVMDKVDFIANADIVLADQRYNDYLYSVPSQFANTERAAFTASAGYVETAVVLGLATQPHPDWRIFAAYSLASFAGSANEDSPLFETDLSPRFALGIVWTGLRSKKNIDVYSSN